MMSSCTTHRSIPRMPRSPTPVPRCRRLSLHGMDTRSFRSPSSRGYRHFRGAEGYGAYTKGGRGGRLLVVDNLNDAGPGTLAPQSKQRPAKLPEFRVGGDIVLHSKIIIRNPNLTVDASSAPTPGITLRRHGLEVRTRGHPSAIPYQNRGPRCATRQSKHSPRQWRWRVRFVLHERIIECHRRSSLAELVDQQDSLYYQICRSHHHPVVHADRSTQSGSTRLRIHRRWQPGHLASQLLRHNWRNSAFKAQPTPTSATTSSTTGAKRRHTENSTASTT